VALRHLPEGIGTVGMLLNFAVSLTVSSFTPPPPQEVQDLVEEIRIPSGAGDASAAH
jgi:cation/acetate symporter